MYQVIKYLLIFDFNKYLLHEYHITFNLYCKKKRDTITNLKGIA